MIDCTIVIPHKDQAEYLRECLQHLEGQQADISWEVIIVSQGDLPFLITSDRVTVSHTDMSNPYTSRNIGIKSANGTYIAFLDAKCSPDPDWLQTMYQAVDASKSIAVGRYNIILPSKKTQDQIYGLMYLNNEKNVTHNYGVTAGNLMVPKHVFDEIGLFDDDTVTGQDIAWSKRALRSGYEIKYIDSAIVNYRGQSYQQLKKSTLKYSLGILSQSSSPLLTILKMFLPWRPKTLAQALHYRDMQGISVFEKLNYWILIWWLKIRMGLRMFKKYLFD